MVQHPHEPVFHRTAVEAFNDVQNSQRIFENIGSVPLPRRVRLRGTEMRLLHITEVFNEKKCEVESVGKGHLRSCAVHCFCAST